MKLFYYKNEKIIKKTFTFFSLFLLFFIPFLFVIFDDEQNGYISIKDPEIVFKDEPTQVNDKELFGNYFSDFYFNFDESKFNGWKVSEYFVVIDNKDSGPLSIGNNLGKDLIWTSQIYDDYNEAEKSLAFKYLVNDFTTEEEKLEILTKIIQSEKFENNYSAQNPILKNISESSGSWRVSGAFNLTYSYQGSKLSKELTINKNFKVIRPTIENEYNVTLSRPLIDQYYEDIDGSQHFSNFFAENNYYYLNNLTTKIYPWIYLNNQNEYRFYDQIPTMDLKITATSSNPVLEEKVIFDQSNLLVNQKENAFIFDSKFLGDDDLGLYNEKNELIYDDVYIDGKFSWSLKSNIEIGWIIKSSDPNIDKVNFYGLDESSRSETIIFSNLIVDDVDAFKLGLNFRKSTLPNYIVNFTWDQNENFVLNLATKDPWIFESENYSSKQAKSQMLLKISDYYGSNSRIVFNVLKMKKEYSPEFGTYYFTQLSSVLNLNSKTNYYITELLYTEFSISDGKKIVPYPSRADSETRKVSLLNNENVIVSNSLDDFQEDKWLLLLDEKISIWEVKHNFNKRNFINFLIIIIFILFIIPIFLTMLYVIYLKYK